MNTAWVVTIVRRAAEECKEREIRRAKLYEALDFLEKNIDAPVLLKQYRRALQGDRQNNGRKNNSTRFSGLRSLAFSGR
jgi:FixJ family two-component response regulator